jgi:hypothetical protein
MKLVYVKGVDDADVVTRLLEKHHESIPRERKVQIARMLMDKVIQGGASSMRNFADYLDRLEEGLLFSFLSPHDAISDDQLAERLLMFVLSDGEVVGLSPSSIPVQRKLELVHKLIELGLQRGGQDTLDAVEWLDGDEIELLTSLVGRKLPISDADLGNAVIAFLLLNPNASLAALSSP